MHQALEAFVRVAQRVCSVCAACVQRVCSVCAACVLRVRRACGLFWGVGWPGGGGILARSRAALAQRHVPCNRSVPTKRVIVVTWCFHFFG